MTVTEQTGAARGPTGSMRTHTVIGGGGLRLHAREWGNPDGPPIVFMHGWSQSHLCWSKQYDSPLAGEFRLVAYDLRGHGMSEAPPEPEHYLDGRLWADDLAAVIDQLRAPRHGRAHPGDLPDRPGVLVRRRRSHPSSGAAGPLQP
jgi:alpha-beta hydrolase superfamily lysophospholipase